SWWLGSHRSKANIEFLKAAARLNTDYIKRQLAVSENMLSGYAFDSIAKSLPKLNYPMPDLKSTVADFTASFSKLFGPSLGIQDFLKLPEYAVSGASREVFLTAHVISKIPAEQIEPKPEEASVIDEATQESSSCIELLKEVDPALTRPFVGAHEAMRTGSSDRARHVLVSLREFWDHLLRRLAPDEQVLDWIPEAKNDYLHKGKPTRPARFSYVCRNIDHKPLRKFVQHDSRMYSILFDLFQRVHDLGAGLSDEQLRAIVLRSDSMLLYILKIHGEPI
ncbi:hypothetical protein J7M28_03210, partial [bacterium]|nr:hypothetical protein [bacterium]